LVHVLAASHRGAKAVGRVEDFVRETLGHRLLATHACEVNKPAQSKGGCATGTNLDRHLIRGTTNATRAHFKARTHLVKCLLQNCYRVVAALLTNALQRTVNDALGHGLFAADEHLVYELSDDRRVVDRVNDEGTLRSWALTRSEERRVGERGVYEVVQDGSA